MSNYFDHLFELPQVFVSHNYKQKADA